jgi:ABC-type antimicrobial peptide transport system permease subunit
VDVRAIHSIEGDKTVIDFTGLTEPAREQTSARVEALHLSVHNMSLVLDVGADSLNRSYGCLYGIERYGDNPLVYVPPSVSFLSGIQKILSLILVFLIGLALRNTLRMR